ncbi:response regulator [Methyloversatilis discipulorum]|uniref:response regulator n=1 Tax=Methyloversatilis discipulorum TaxID=1119528 RepID=UPI001A487C71|nr:HD domain-containing phosphohydrolase [Methyloversatilis discipulorum]MBL8468463.1 response regulator [Methyloversatilis discipulorum]
MIIPNGPILLVDDEPANLGLLKSILSPDYRLVFATNGPDALEAVRKHAPSLILLDVQMPGMDGYSVCRELKRNEATHDIPVLFVTSLGEDRNEADAFMAGAVDFLVKPVSPIVVRARVSTHLSLVRASRLEASYRDAISMLGTAGHYNDSDTGVHIWRMAAYAQELARTIGWPAEDLRLIELAAPMHDTGKIGIPDAILKKPGALDAGEWIIMRTHTTIGHGILSRSEAPVFRLAAEIALRHHEKWDGSGYPDGLSGEAIPESARIVAIADVFDALTMKRPYKEPWPIDKVVATIIDGAGRHFDPRLVEVFKSILPELLAIRTKWEVVEQEQSSTGVRTDDHATCGAA